MEFEIPENSNFGFSAVDPEDMATPEDEYTLVSLTLDASPSTTSVRDSICVGMKTLNLACKKNPRSDKMMIQNTVFGSRIEEIHGFIPVNDIDETDYKPISTVGGSTCLLDSIFNSVSAIGHYAKILDQSDIGSNGMVFVFTDGMDNDSTIGHQTILDKLEELKMEEILESIKIIILGFYDPKSSYATRIVEYLNDLVQELQLDQFVDIGQMTPEQAAKTFGFVSQSISSQSQALGTGGPSQNLTF